MKHVVLIIVIAIATPLAAQTSNDDMPAIENWLDKVGADFFGKATMDELRPENEIRAQWTGPSADDQAASLARCAKANGQSAGASTSLQEGSTDEGEDSTAEQLADEVPALVGPDGEQSAQAAEATSSTGSVSGKKIQVPAADGAPAPDTGLAGATGGPDNKMIRICELIPNL